MIYKKSSNPVDKEKAIGLKWVLVTSYGYLRFREFKLGLPSSHMAICSYAREVLLKTMHMAEERGFEVIHGIVDSLFIRKKGITEKEVNDFCTELGLEIGIPVDLEGIFKWACFLPSVNDPERPTPATYFGAFRNGGTKARGIEVRQESAPLVVRDYQQKVLDMMALSDTVDDVRAMVPDFVKLLLRTAKNLNTFDARFLAAGVHVSKTEYKNNIAQKKALDALKKRGVEVNPGQLVHFVFDRTGVVLPDEFTGHADKKYYTKLLVRSLFIVLQPFGYTRDEVELLATGQTLIDHFREKLITSAAIQTYSRKPLVVF